MQYNWQLINYYIKYLLRGEDIVEIPVSEKLHFNRLNSKNIVIEEIYKNDNDEILVRSTDGLRNDTIINCKRIEKRYFHNEQGIYIKKNFDKDAKYK